MPHDVVLFFKSDTSSWTAIELYGYDDGSWSDRYPGCQPDNLQHTYNSSRIKTIRSDRGTGILKSWEFISEWSFVNWPFQQRFLLLTWIF